MSAGPTIFDARVWPSRGPVPAWEDRHGSPSGGETPSTRESSQMRSPQRMFAPVIALVLTALGAS